MNILDATNFETTSNSREHTRGLPRLSSSVNCNQLAKQGCNSGDPGKDSSKGNAMQKVRSYLLSGHPLELTIDVTLILSSVKFLLAIIFN